MGTTLWWHLAFMKESDRSYSPSPQESHCEEHEAEWSLSVTCHGDIVRCGWNQVPEQL